MKTFVFIIIVVLVEMFFLASVLAPQIFQF
jgi:hypothetical protein